MADVRICKSVWFWLENISALKIILISLSSYCLVVWHMESCLMSSVVMRI